MDVLSREQVEENLDLICCREGCPACEGDRAVRDSHEALRTQRDALDAILRDLIADAEGAFRTSGTPDEDAILNAIDRAQKRRCEVLGAKPATTDKEDVLSEADTTHKRAKCADVILHGAGLTSPPQLQNSYFLSLKGKTQ